MSDEDVATREGDQQDVADAEDAEQNAMFTASQREHLRGDDAPDRATRQRLRDRLGATVGDLGLALREMERRDVGQVGETLSATEVDEAIAFLELLRRHTPDAGDRATINVEYEGGDVQRLEARLDRLEDGISGLSAALENIGDVE